MFRESCDTKGNDCRFTTLQPWRHVLTKLAEENRRILSSQRTHAILRREWSSYYPEGKIDRVLSRLQRDKRGEKVLGRGPGPEHVPVQSEGEEGQGATVIDALAARHPAIRFWEACYRLHSTGRP